jgi:hypothetical protein
MHVVSFIAVVEVDDLTSFGFVVTSNDCQMLFDCVLVLLNNIGLGVRVWA